MDLPIIIAVFAGLLVLISLVQPMATRLRVAPSVLLAVIGVAIGLASAAIIHIQINDVLSEVATVLVSLPIHSEAFLYIFLPILLFQTSLTLDVRRMAEDAGPILLLAVVAVIVATFVIGLALAPVSGEMLVVCLLLGAIVATTDPVAVVSIFRDIGAPGRLSRLVEGESLLNDAAAITLFVVLLDLIVAGRSVDLVESTWRFVSSFVGGLATGYVLARLMLMIMPLGDEQRFAQVTLTFALPYLVYVLCEQVFGVSGVVGVVSAGLVVGLTGHPRISPDNWRYLEGVWDQGAFWASSLIFILASMLIPKFMLDVGLQDLLLLGVLVIAALVARSIVLFGLLPVLSALRIGQYVSHPFKVVILWGGLRGAVTLALALAVTENKALSPEIQRFIAVLATGFVFFTLLVNGTTLRLLIRLLGLDQLSPIDKALRDQVLALSQGSVHDAVLKAAQDYKIAPALAREIATPYEQAAIAASGRDRIDGNISQRDRVTLALVALGNRERELIMDHFQQRTVSRRLVELLLTNAARLVEGARGRGLPGYNRAAKQETAFGQIFRVAQLLQWHLGIERMLARLLGDRFESLLVNRIVIEGLLHFVDGKIAQLHGRQVADTLRSALNQRLDGTLRALEAVRLQYPDYSDALERRFLRKIALRREDRECRELYAEGLIGPELFADLQREIGRRQAAADQRPPLDLGLNRRDLIAQFPMFAGFTREQADAVERLLKSRFALPGRRLIRRGDRGDVLYFISSGAVEVHVNGDRIRLGRGDFFGELALLSGTPRRSDVVTLGYCRLLVLDVEDFKALMDLDESIRQQIKRIAAERERMNRDAALAPLGRQAGRLPLGSSAS